jgi:hypothetical protein
VRQVVESYAGQRLTSEENCLHIVLTGAIGSELDAPSRFNQMSPLERTRIARDALARAGVVDLAPAGRAMDEAPEDYRVSAEDRDAFREILARLRSRRKPRGADRHDENRVAADNSATAALDRDCKRTRDFGYAETDRGSKLPRSTRVMDARPLGYDGRPMNDLEYYRNAAFETTGGVY